MSEATAGDMPQLLYDTLPPDAISEELAPVIDELGLRENCRQLAMEGWTVVEAAASEEFFARLAAKIKEQSPDLKDGVGGANMLLAKDPVFAEAALNPKIMAMAEFSVGGGFLVTQIASSIISKGPRTVGLHADSSWLPAPFPAHNMLLTACWACTDYTKEGGATMVIPGSQVLHRHPNAEETDAMAGAIAIECPAGSVVMWDGNIWHGNWPRQIDGERVVCHVAYTRLMMRPVEDYSAHADALISQYGQPMSQLLGREDFLYSPSGFDPTKRIATMNNARS
jgi:hypothetical protein